MFRAGSKREARWFSRKQVICRNPECGRTWGLVLHHVVYEQHVRDAHGDVDDPDNSMTLCVDCHQRHHQTSWRIPASWLSWENVRFMVKLLGLFNGGVYLRRYYDVEGR